MFSIFYFLFCSFFVHFFTYSKFVLREKTEIKNFFRYIKKERKIKKRNEIGFFFTNNIETNKIDLS